MGKNIKFTNMLGLDFFPPRPAIKNIPEWYKNTPEYINENPKEISLKDDTSHSIKKCMPVFDAMTSGYILYTQVDVQVTKENGITFYKWPDQDAIHFHPVEQAPLYPIKSNYSYPKWNNPYSISTPVGYSTMFLPPTHRESIFTILAGIVDTDKYIGPIAFPFVLNDLNWEGIIPAGTPMAQVIPFKREIWKHEIGSSKDIEKIIKNIKQLRIFFLNSYKKQFWNRKQYN